MLTEKDMLPCPFCGSEAMVDTIDPNADSPWVASCTNEESDCAGVIYRPNAFYGTRDAAIAAWNYRVPNMIITNVEATPSISAAARADDADVGQTSRED